MKILVERTQHNEFETIGKLSINGQFACYTLEDPHHDVKIWGNTRIPQGTYKLGLRTVGGKHTQYKAKYPTMHKGMLHVLDVPKFQYILIHVGNTNIDTHGCLLVGLGKTNKTITQSIAAYRKIYPIIANAILTEGATIEYKDL
jgi:hypothetical protein